MKYYSEEFVNELANKDPDFLAAVALAFVSLALDRAETYPESEYAIDERFLLNDAQKKKREFVYGLEPLDETEGG